MKIQALAAIVLKKMRAMSETNRSITMPAATFFALTDIVNGTYLHQRQQARDVDRGDTGIG